jgi:predicted ATP-grasp superfamily ATP-dependent carboligase
MSAVVIKGNLNGLGVVRSLGRGGVGSHVVDASLLAPAMWSRHAAPFVVPSIQGLDLVDALLALREGMTDQPMLFNCDEMAVLTISEHRSRLEGSFRFRLPEHETVFALQDKAKFQELARGRGLNIPVARVVRRIADISALRSLRYPLVAKPADKRFVHSGAAPGVTIFESFSQASDGCARMLEEAGHILVQEWVEGANDQIYFCLFYRGRDNKTVSMFTGRKLLSTPKNIGTTAYCSAAPEAREALEPMTESFCDAVGYEGMGSVEYTWDAGARRFVIIEPTVGRTDWQEEIATLCGVNIPLEAYCHEYELPAPSRLPPKRKVVWRSSCLEVLKVGAPALPAAARLHDGYWRWDDPMPALVQYSLGLAASAWRQSRREVDALRGRRRREAYLKG